MEISEAHKILKRETARSILSKIIDIRIEALDKIDFADEKWFLSQFGVDTEEVANLSKQQCDEIASIHKNPFKIFLLPEIEISILRHILFRMEDEWIFINPAGVREIWELFFYIEESREPKLKLVNNFLKLKK